MNLQELITLESKRFSKDLNVIITPLEYDSAGRKELMKFWDANLSIVKESNRRIAQDTIDLIKERVGELGHQQEDNTIWCNMDEILDFLNTLSNNQKKDA